MSESKFHAGQAVQLEPPNQLAKGKKEKSHQSKVKPVIAGSKIKGKKEGKGRKDSGILTEEIISIPKKGIRRDSTLHISP